MVAIQDPTHQVHAAEPEGQAHFNAACVRGGPVPRQTEVGLRLVWRVTPEWWEVCGPDDTTAYFLPGRNDGGWAALRIWGGAPRHPLFVQRLRGRNARRRP
jgi:hypothetical protein